MKDHIYPRNLASFASFYENSRGRIYPEPESKANFVRSPFQRDRDRIIHCTAFRRLGHKTQVFVSPKGDHIRTRLTHSIEVAQIARSMARMLRVDEDLTEAIALAHDLGHTPFGHSGEDRLAELMQPFGGFDHNDHALRILTKLEQRYPNMSGLNLNLETIEGIVKHNGPIVKKENLPATLASLCSEVDLRLDHYAGLEAQIAGIADDIAYNHHDMDDGLKAGLFRLEEIMEAVPHIGIKNQELSDHFPTISNTVRINSLVRELIGDMVEDGLKTSLHNLEQLQATKGKEALLVDDIALAGRPIIHISAKAKLEETSIKKFLYAKMYRSPLVMVEREQGQEIIAFLFKHYLHNPELLPQEWQDSHPNLSKQAEDFKKGSPLAARRACDYVAGMTDRFAKRTYEALKA